MDNKLIISLSNLPLGSTTNEWKIGKELFEAFNNYDIIDADLNVNICVEKKVNYFGLKCNISGEIVVPCDRCLDDVVFDVDEKLNFTVKFGDEPIENKDKSQQEENIIYFSSDSQELDLSQLIYDYCILSLPMRKVHEDGECSEDMFNYLKNDSKIDSDNPFLELKKKFKE